MMLFYELDSLIWDIQHHERAFEVVYPEVSIWLTSLMILTIASDIVLSAPTLSSNTNVTESELKKLLPQLLDNKYPITAPISNSDGSMKYRIAIVSDLDGNSKIPTENKWISHFKRGYLTYNPQNENVFIEWDSEMSNFTSYLSVKNKGLELSELVTYNKNLITVDDKTDIVYTIDGNKFILCPWVIVVSGNGCPNGVNKGTKMEWATVKDSKLYVGSTGTELVSHGVADRSLMWVKEIDKNGAVGHLNWESNYSKLREAVRIEAPGYVVHESCVWSDVHGRWYFLPRKISYGEFEEIADETQNGANVLLAATPDFEDIKVTRIGQRIPEHGYSSFKFIPGTNDTVIAAISTMEINDTTATFITAFTIDGEIIYPETRVSDLKFEGFEFI